jgi:hypothetical protein
MSGAIPPLPSTPQWCGVQLKHRDNFTFIIYIILYLFIMIILLINVPLFSAVALHSDRFMHSMCGIEQRKITEDAQDNLCIS